MNAQNESGHRPGGGNDRRPGWMVYRIGMFLAAASLAVYIPYKYATQLHAISGLYALLFPLSGILAILGMVYAVRPGLALRTPVVLRAIVGGLAVGWIATGALCIPSLTEQVVQSPGAGLFAVFHMSTQHIVLSFLVAALALAPQALYRQFGVPVPELATDTAEEPAPANV